MVAPAGRSRDVSHWQTLTGQPLAPQDWDMVKISQGARYRDREARQFLDAFKTAGTRHLCGYLYLTTTATAQQQVDNFMAGVRATGHDLDVAVIDWEIDEVNKIAPVEVVEEVYRLLVKQFPARPGGTFRVGVYTSDWVAGFRAWRARNPLVPLFYANYNTNPTSTAGGWQESARYGAVCWQWTSKGVDPGFTAGIDLNHTLNRVWLDGLKGADVSCPTPPVEPPPPAPIPVPPPAPGFPTVGIPTAPLRRGDGGRQVGRLIAILKAFKWYPAQFAADLNNQAYGPRCEAGVRAFQQWAGLPVTGAYGELDYQQLVALERELTGIGAAA